MRLFGYDRSELTRTRSDSAPGRDDRRRHRERVRRAERRVEEHPAGGDEVAVRVRRAAAVRVKLEVEVRVDPVRVSRVADEADQLPGLDPGAALQPFRERDPDLAAAAVVVAGAEVVVQVDVVVGRPAPAVEVEHAARPAGAGVEADASRLGRERVRVPGREDVDSLVAALRPRGAVVVRELGRRRAPGRRSASSSASGAAEPEVRAEAEAAGPGRPGTRQRTLRRCRRGLRREVLGLSSGSSP